MSSTSERRARELLAELKQRGMRAWIDEGGAHFEPSSLLPPVVREELRSLRDEVMKCIVEQGEEVVTNYVANDPEAVVTNRVTPTPELSKSEKLAAAVKAFKRPYQSGAVLVNYANNYGAYLRRLREQREEQEARERGELPPAGFYQTLFNEFD
jgi:hypothetical protein